MEGRQQQPRRGGRAWPLPSARGLGGPQAQRPWRGLGWRRECLQSTSAEPWQPCQPGGTQDEMPFPSLLPFPLLREQVLCLHSALIDF